MSNAKRKANAMSRSGSWKGQSGKMIWYQQEECRSKIAAFDLDHTLIKPKSGAKFPTDRSDWVYLSKTIKPKLTKLHGEGYSIVIFTNQAGIEKKKQKESDIRGKIEDLEQDLGIPIHSLVACAQDHYRKPSTTMWKLLEKKYDNIDRSQSFYCGDAAARPKNWTKGAKKDFSSSDRSFALNLGLKFYMPEELFFKEDCSRVPFELDGLDPKTLFGTSNNDEEAFNARATSKNQEMVVFVGWPASGKSSLYRNQFAPHGYVHINQDTLGSKDRCHREAKSALARCKSVVIDNTNPSVADRKPYIDMAKAKRTSIRCLVMGTSREAAVHNNFFRVKETNGKIRRIPAVAYNTYNKRLEPPNKKEGFDEVETVPFVARFEQDDDGSKKKMYLERVEKV